jgi:DUF438 domain-containing protein
MENSEFRIDFKGDKILIRNFPVHDKKGSYLGVAELIREIVEIQKLIGEKRLPD